MKLVIQAYDYGLVGGIARYLDNYIGALKKIKGVEIIVITAKKPELDNNPNFSKGIRLIQLPMENNRLGLKNWSKLCKSKIDELALNENIDFVNLQIPPLIPGLYLSNKVKYVVTAHSTYYGWTKHYKRTMGLLELFLKKKMEASILKKVNKVIVLTAQAKEDLVEIGVKKDNVLVYPNGVDLKIFSKSKSKVKKFDVLFCGRIEERKGSRSLVKLSKILIEKNKKIKIGIVGFGDDENYVSENLKSEISSGNVIFAGKVEPAKVAEYYKSSKVYVSCSYNEGLPGTCLEAMSCGLPVVVWDLYFYKGLVLGEKSGFLIEKDNFEEASIKILNLLSNSKLRTEFGKIGSKIISSNYSMDSIALNIVNELKKCEK